jgi:hypothetical protein
MHGERKSFTWTEYRDLLTNVSFTGFAHLLRVIKRGIRRIQYQPGLIEGCLTGTGLSLEPDSPTS